MPILELKNAVFETEKCFYEKGQNNFKISVSSSLQGHFGAYK